MKQVPTSALNRRIAPTEPTSVEYQDGSGMKKEGKRKREMINRMIRSALF
jgi:hypothetical protein